MLRVVIIGYGEMFTNLIAGTLDANCEIVGVLRKERCQSSKFIRLIKDCINPSVEYNYIKSYNLPEIDAKKVNSEAFKNALIKLNPDIILIGSWGEKIKKDIYEIPKIATINAHPSLLPKYRGPNPYFWVIRNQEQVSGVTFHLLDREYDTGAILAQEEIKIYPSDTGKSLKERSVLIARGVICELLKDLQEDMIIPLQQREDKASYYSYPEKFCLNFNKSAEEISALIRASYPWYQTYFYHKDTCLTVSHKHLEILDNLTSYKTPGTITNINSNTRLIEVLCANNKILAMQIHHYKPIDRFFTSNYIKLEMKVGEIL